MRKDKNYLVIVLLFALKFDFLYAAAFSIFTNPYFYSRQYTDEESRLQYLSARYYDPSALRFISVDSYDFLNRYAYCNDNPIGNEDPSGHEANFAGDIGSMFGFFVTFEIGASMVDTVEVAGKVNKMEVSSQLGKASANIFISTVASGISYLSGSFFSGSSIKKTELIQNFTYGEISQLFVEAQERFTGYILTEYGGMSASQANKWVDSSSQISYNIFGAWFNNSLYGLPTDLQTAGFSTLLDTSGYFISAGAYRYEHSEKYDLLESKLVAHGRLKQKGASLAQETEIKNQLDELNITFRRRSFLLIKPVIKTLSYTLANN